jgi:hypothetical protein
MVTPRTMYELSLHGVSIARYFSDHLYYRSHSIAAAVDNQVALLHDERSPAQQIRRRRLDRRVFRITIPPVLWLPTEQIRPCIVSTVGPGMFEAENSPVEGYTSVVPLAREQMPLNEEVRVILVEARIRIGHAEERWQALAPREQLFVEAQDGRVVGQLNRESVVRYPTHNLRELVPVPDQYDTATERWHVPNNHVCVDRRLGHGVTSWVEIRFQLLVIQVGRGPSIRVRIGDARWPAYQERDGPIEVIELCPSSPADLNFPFVIEIENRAVTVQAQLESSRQGGGSLRWSACEQPKRGQRLV